MIKMRHMMSSLLFVLMLVLSMPVIALGDSSVDFKAMTNSEIEALLDEGRRELKQRQLSEEGHPVVADTELLRVYFTSRYYIADDYTGAKILHMEATFVNKADYDITVTQKCISIDGWECQLLNPIDISAGKMKKADVTARISDAGYSTIDEIKEIECSFNVYKSDSLLQPVQVTEPLSFVRS